MNILDKSLMGRLQKIQITHLTLVYEEETGSILYGCRNQCSGSCEGDCEGSCDTSCYGGCEGTFGYDDYDDID